jgi:hypothetical protein
MTMRKVNTGWAWRLTSTISATWEAEIRESRFEANPSKKFETLSEKHKLDMGDHTIISAR